MIRTIVRLVVNNALQTKLQPFNGILNLVFDPEKFGAVIWLQRFIFMGANIKADNALKCCRTKESVQVTTS